MEKEILINLDFSKPKSRKCSESINKILGLPENMLIEENYNDCKDLLVDEIKQFSLEKSNLLKDEKEEIKSKKIKKESPPAAIKTFCRIRPTDNLNDTFKVKDTDTGLLLVNMDPATLKKFNGVSSFTFSRIFDEKSSQKEVFDETCLILIQDIILKRKSGLIFTYGMTNAGKTFTVVGSKENPGILPQSLSLLYEKIQNGENGINKFKVFCNFIEVYNEEVFDLLANDPKNPKFKKKVNIKEKDKKFFVQDPTYCEINKLEDFNAALARGINKKVHTSNNINQNSSRSHTIFKIILKTDLANEDEINLSIVDLAGSERANRTEAQGKELQEACKINQSLSVLGKCMEALKHNSIYMNKKIVPFRESKLTMLFQEYFTGDQNILMITNINPRKEDFEETMRALNYSCIAKEIKKAKIIVNPIKKQVKLEESNIGNVSLLGENENVLNINDKNNFLIEENNKTTIKNNPIKADLNVNPFKIDDDNRMSFTEFHSFKEDLRKIKSQLDIITSNNFSNNIHPHYQNFSQFNPYLNNSYYGIPNAINTNLTKENENIQTTVFLGNNSNNVLEDERKVNIIENDYSNTSNYQNGGRPNNINSNIYNNYYSANSNHHPAMGFMQNFPFLFPINLQLLPSHLNPFIQANLFNKNIKKNDKNKDLNNIEKENFENNFDLLTNESIDVVNLGSCFSGLENFSDNSLNNKDNKIINNPNFSNSSKNDLGINIPPSVNTFNMVFINTKINDINLGNQKRNFQKKKSEEIAQENNEEEIEKSKGDSSDEQNKKNKKVNKEKKDESDKKNKNIKKVKKGKKKKDSKSDWLEKYDNIRNKVLGDINQ